MGQGHGPGPGPMDQAIISAADFKGGTGGSGAPPHPPLKSAAFAASEMMARSMGPGPGPWPWPIGPGSGPGPWAPAWARVRPWSMAPARAHGPGPLGPGPALVHGPRPGPAPLRCAGWLAGQVYSRSTKCYYIARYPTRPPINKISTPPQIFLRPSIHISPPHPPPEAHAEIILKHAHRLCTSPAP